MLKVCPICNKTRESYLKPSKSNPHDLCADCYRYKRVFKIALRCSNCDKLKLVNRGSSTFGEPYICRNCFNKLKMGEHLEKARKARKIKSRCFTDRGYAVVIARGHRLQNKNGRVKEHFVVVDSIVGNVFQPSKGHVIHHVDGNPKNNSPNNLVLCENQGYHRFIHKRAKAFYACGDPTKVKCQYCGGYSHVEDLVRKGHNTFHESCYRQYLRDTYQVKLTKKRESAGESYHVPFIQGESANYESPAPQAPCH